MNALATLHLVLHEIGRGTIWVALPRLHRDDLVHVDVIHTTGET